MNKKGFIDFELDSETIVAAGLSIAGGLIALFVMKSSPLGPLWRVITFASTAALCFFVVKFILNK